MANEPQPDLLRMALENPNGVDIALWMKEASARILAIEHVFASVSEAEKQGAFWDAVQRVFGGR